ncbi:MAG: hypothetical protein ACOC97_04065 [Myxococcota bacterium]
MRRAGRQVLGWVIAAWIPFATSAVSVAAAQEGRQPQVIQLEEIKIEGRVQKPNAFYILNRSNIGYEVMDLRTSFVDKIVRSVQEEPF